jgi:3-hydroxyisobutyrate dehydrogenase
MNLGYVGLGNMGGALARCLMLKQKLRVHDLRPEAVAAFAADGAIATQGGAALAAQCDVVITCLPTSQNVRDAIFGKGGLLEGLSAGKIIIDQTTGDPQETRAMAAELAKQGIDLIDAPVSGGPHGAQAGTIAIMVGGSDEVFARVKPIFEIISPNVFHCGGVGNGHVTKLVNNVIAAGMRAVTFEAVAMGIKNGLTLESIVPVIDAGSAHSAVTQGTLPKLMDGMAPVNFSLALMLKDVRLATQLGVESRAPMFMANMVRDMLQADAFNYGDGADLNETIRTFERNADVKIVKER